MLGMVNNILDILTQSLLSKWDCPRTVFDSLFEEPSILMRLLHYDPVPSQSSRQFGGKFTMVSAQLNIFFYCGPSGVHGGALT